MNHINLNKKIILLGILLLTVNCSKKENNDDAAATSQVDLYKAAASTATDEAVEAIVENGSSQSYSPMSSPLSNTLAVSRSCTASNGTATVVLTFSGSSNYTISKTLASASVDVSVDVTKTGTETRVWSPSMSCDGTNQYAAVDWSSTGAGSTLTLNVDLNRVINRDKTITVTKNSTTTTKTASDDVTVTGTRSITWAAPSLSSGQVSRTKSITSSVTRARVFTRASGAVENKTSTVVTESSSPLNVTVVRNNTTKELVSKTINSGVVKVTESDGMYTSCSFSGVTYDMAATNKCLPTGGSISCSVYDSSTATTASSSMTIQFGASTTSTVSISVDGATAEDYPDYNSKGCELETAG